MRGAKGITHSKRISTQADPKDVDRLESELSPGVLVKRIDLPTYAHLDFSWGFDAHTLLYPQVLDLLGRAARGEFAR